MAQSEGLTVSLSGEVKQVRIATVGAFVEIGTDPEIQEPQLTLVPPERFEHIFTESGVLAVRQRVSEDPIRIDRGTVLLPSNHGSVESKPNGNLRTGNISLRRLQRDGPAVELGMGYDEVTPRVKLLYPESDNQQVVDYTVQTVTGCVDFLGVEAGAVDASSTTGEITLTDMHLERANCATAAGAVMVKQVGIRGYDRKPITIRTVDGPITVNGIVGEGLREPIVDIKTLAGTVTVGHECKFTIAPFDLPQDEGVAAAFAPVIPDMV